MAGEQGLTVGEFFQLLGYISGALVFIILIGLDMRNAFKKGAHWVPGHALILSALTIQVMNFIANQSTLLNESLENVHNVHSGNIIPSDILLSNLFVIHTTRVMLCVMVAFFLPAMARPGYEEKWTKIAAVGLTVFLDVFYELSAVHKNLGGSAGFYWIYSSIFDSLLHAEKVDQVPFFVSGAVITMTLIWLILLLICAAIASKSIRHITTQKIPIILAEHAENTWKGVEDQVLKSWIVAGACYPESFIARSVLASSAAVGVTICIICSVAGWISHCPIISFSYGVESGLKLATTILEVIFILMGWVVICWRSLSSVGYYGRWRKEDEVTEESWFAYFQIEDFWTRHLVELQEAENLKLRKLKVDERVSKMFVSKLRKLRVDERLSKMIAKEKKRTSLVSTLLQCMIWVQRFVVFTSKIYWLLSQLTFGNLYIRRIVSKIFSRHFKKVNTEFQDFQAILKNIDHVLWDQTARDVFLTNRKSIKEATQIMSKGEKDGGNCHNLILFLGERSSSLRCDVGIMCLQDPESAQEKTGFKFLWKLRPLKMSKDGEKYFKYASKRSWKLTTVTLINVFVLLSTPRGTDCLEAYYEAWELIDLVDESDPGTNRLLSKAADRLFTKLREPGPERPAITTMEAAAESIKELADKSEKDAENIHGKIVKGKDSMQDWENLAAWNALYTLCKSIDCPLGGNFMELLAELESVLADIIGACIKGVATALLENSRKRAVDLDKRKLLEAVYIAGKSKGLMEKLDWEPTLQLKGDSRRGESVWCSNVQTAPTTGEIG